MSVDTEKLAKCLFFCAEAENEQTHILSLFSSLQWIKFKNFETLHSSPYYVTPRKHLLLENQKFPLYSIAEDFIRLYNSSQCVFPFLF